MRRLGNLVGQTFLDWTRASAEGYQGSKVRFNRARFDKDWEGKAVRTFKRSLREYFTEFILSFKVLGWEVGGLFIFVG